MRAHTLVVMLCMFTLLAGSAVSPQPSVPEQKGAQKNAAEKSPSETKVIDKNGAASAQEQKKAGTSEKKQPGESAGPGNKSSATNGAKEARKEAPAPQIIVPRPEPDKALKKDVTPQPQPEKAQKKDTPAAPIVAPQPPRNQVKKKEDRRVAPARQQRRQAARQPKAPRKDTLPKAGRKDAAGARIEAFDKAGIRTAELAGKTVHSMVLVSALRNSPHAAWAGTGKNDYQSPPARIAASGVIYDRLGHILTSAIAIERARSITVTLADKKEVNCSLLGADTATGLAVLKMESGTEKLTAIRLMDTDRLLLGEPVVALGSLTDYPGYVSMGVVAGVGRHPAAPSDYEHFISTDAVINPGNTGGPLVNMKGEMVGLNLAIQHPNGVFTGTGIAIPANTVKKIADEIIDRGRISRGWIGANLLPLTREMAAALYYDRPTGVLVSSLAKHSPAARADFRAGDIIAKIDGADVVNPAHVRRSLAWRAPGSRVSVTVFRNQAYLDLVAEVEDTPSREITSRMERVTRRDDFGFLARDIDEELSYRYKVSPKAGVVVIHVKEGSPAQACDLRPGDAITEINRTPAENFASFKNLMEEVKDQNNVLLMVNRMGMSKFMVITRPAE